MRKIEASEAASQLRKYGWAHVPKAARKMQGVLMAKARWTKAAEMERRAEQDRQQSLEVAKGTGE